MVRPRPPLGIVLALSLVLLPGVVRGQQPSAAPSRSPHPAPAATLVSAHEASLIGAFEIEGSPLVRAEDRIEVSLALERPVDDLDLRVVSFAGDTVRRLASGPRDAGELRRSWNGKGGRGQAVADGAYRIVAAATQGGSRETREAWVTIADRAVYPQQPGFITVLLDPGHDATRSGAVGRDDTREADLNLDIALRAARMLEGAGVDVVLTRETNRDVNDPAADLTGDGLIDDTDELAARPDIANRARADLFISVHNNFAVNRSVGGPSTFFYDDRPFGDRSALLARTIQSAMVGSLSRFAEASWSPYDHGALIYPYYVLRGYDPPRLQRPTQMPGVLSEGLFLSNPRELRMLKRPVVRQAMAEAYYDAIARYLARRSDHVGYELRSGPEVATAGEEIEFEVQVRNQGTRPMRGWRLAVGALPRQTPYEGRGRTGRTLAERRIPRLGPGRQATVSVRLRAPAPGRDWTLLFDARDPDGRRASRIGSPVLQVPFTSTDPPPSASPSPVPERHSPVPASASSPAD